MTADTTHVKVVLTADARPYERALAGAARSASTVDKSMAQVKTTTDKAAGSADSVSESMKEVAEETGKANLAATALGTAISFIGAKAVGALNQAISAASDFNETISKMETVFGSGAGEVKRFFENSAKDFGLSKQAAYDAATGIATMGKAAGLSGTELAQFSNKTVALAADLASFYNAAGGAEEVIYSLSSAMRGEYESARRWNILLDDMTLRQRALTMGIVETTKLALTPQQKVLAVQAELFAQTGDAQGDYARTADGLANSQRSLTAQMADARVELGQNLLPLMLAGVQILSTLVDAFNGLGDGTQRAIAYLAAAAAAFALLGPPIKGLITLLELARAGAIVTSIANVGLAVTFRAVGWSALFAAGAIAKMLWPIAAVVGGMKAMDWLFTKVQDAVGGNLWFGGPKHKQGESVMGEAFGAGKESLLGPSAKTDKDAVDAEKESADALSASLDAMGAASDAVSGAQAGMAANISEADQAILDQMGSINAHIDAMQNLMSTGDNILGMEDRLRGSAKATAAARSGGAAATKAETEAQNKAIAGIRKRENAEQEAEIKRARRAAQRKADRRADREAREAVQAGSAAFIEADKALKRGEDVDEISHGETVGEREGKLTKAEQKGLDEKIEGIRKRHQASADKQIDSLKEQNKASRGAGKAMEYYNTTLDKNTEAGRKNRAAFSAEIDSIQARAGAVYQAAIDAGKGIPEASRLAQIEFDKLIKKLEDAGVEAGYSREDVKKLIREIGLTPDVVETIFKMTVKPEVDTEAMKKIKAEIAGLDALLDGVGDKGSAAAARIKEEADAAAERLKNATPAKPFDPKANKDSQRNASPADARRANRAGGGEVYGPGSSTSDSVPLWASRGEFVVNASQYAANRDLVRAINASSGRVNGGMNVGTITVNETTGNRVRMSVIDALAESAYRSGAVR